MILPLYTRYFFTALALVLVNLRLLAAFSVEEAWSTYVGGMYGNDCVKASVLGVAGKLYLGGYLGDGSIMNDDGVFASNYAGAQDAFVAQVDSSGDLVWYSVLGDSENDEVRGLAVQGQSVFAAVWRERTAYLDAGTDALLYSLSTAAGTFNWSAPVAIGAAHTTNGFNAVAVDTTGNIYAAGYTSISGLTPTVTGYQVGGTGPVYGNSLKGNLDACVVKISPAGAILWVHYLGGANEDRALTCTIGTNGFVYVGGETRSSGWVTVPGSVTPSVTKKAGFLVKISPAGNHIWSTYLGGSENDSVAGLAFERVSGRLFAAGSTTSAGFMSTWPRLNTYGGNGDGFVSSITDSGSSFIVNWSKFYGSNQTDTVSSIQQLDDAQMVLGGTTSAGGWLPDADNGWQGGSDGFVTVMADNGDSLWSRYIGGPANDYTYTVAADSGVMYAGGLTLSDDNWVSGGFHVEWDKDNLFGGAEQFGYSVKYVSSGYIPDPPAIITQPRAISVEEGQSARFTVEAVSVEQIVYQWYVNDAPVTGAANSSFTLSGVTLEQNGDQIFCIVSNIAGSVISDIATLTVTAIPMGWITMELAPAAAVSDGVAWSIDAGSTWLSSGAMVNVLTGVYSIVYKNVFGWAAPTTPGSTTVVNLQTNSLSATFTQIIYSNARYITGTNVVVKVNPPAGTEEWTLRETIPVGLTPYGYPAGTSWNSDTRRLRYEGDGSGPMQFTYSVTGAEGSYQLSGTVYFFPSEMTVTTVGATQVTIAVEPPPPVIPDPDIIGFAPDGGVPGNWLLTFISVLDQSYLIVTNGSPVAGVWAPQSQVNGASGQTTTSVAAPGDTLFYRVRTP